MVEQIDHVLVDGAEQGAPLHQGPAQVPRSFYVGQQQRSVPCSNTPGSVGTYLSTYSFPNFCILYTVPIKTTVFQIRKFESGIKKGTGNIYCGDDKFVT